MVKRQVGGTSNLISVPLYGQVLGILRQRIFDGVYRTGEQLQPEDLLAAEFGVSRTTVRQAVGELVAQGLVDRRQGRGTFVLPVAPDLHGSRVEGSLGDPEGFAITPRNQIIRTEFERGVRIPDRIADALRLEEPTGLLVRRTRTVGGRVYAYAENYMGPRYGDLLTAAEVRKVGLTTLLDSKGIHPGRIDQRIRAQQADVRICEQLNLDFASPVLHAERLLLSDDDEPIKFRRSWYPADLFEYRVTLRRDLGGEFRPSQD